MKKGRGIRLKGYKKTKPCGCPVRWNCDCKEVMCTHGKRYGGRVRHEKEHGIC